MARHVFTYGSLMFAPVWQRVVAGTYRSAVASLSGHVRFALKDDIYPGMLAQPGGIVQGVVYFDVRSADLQALDRFEGAQYERRTVQVLTAGPAQALNTVAAETYLCTAVECLSDDPWEPATFALQRFVDTYCHERLGARGV